MGGKGIDAEIKSLLAENNMLRAENEKLKASIKQFNDWYLDGKRFYSEGHHEKAIRHLCLGRGKHGRIVAPRDVLLDYIKAGYRLDSKQKAVEFIQEKYNLQSYGSTIKYIRRALDQMEKEKPGNPSIKEVLKNLIPGNPP